MHLQVSWQGFGRLGHERPHKLHIWGQRTRPLQRKVDIEKVHDAPSKGLL